MEYGFKTALRHALVAALLGGLLPVLFGPATIGYWLRANALFLGVWLAGLGGLGWLADLAVLRGWFAAPGTKQKSHAVVDLFRRWGTCSRCVGYWWGGIFSFGAAALYLPAWFPGAVYFAALGAALCTTVAVSRFLWRRRAESEQSSV